MLDALLRLVCPDRCAACDAITEPPPGLCSDCRPALYELDGACPICAEPQQSAQPIACSRCRRRPPAFARAHAPYLYGSELAEALLRLKFGGGGKRGRVDLVRPLACLLTPAMARLAPGFDAIVPVPLHHKRLRERGFSQAHRLAISARGRLARPAPPVLGHVLLRHRTTTPQATLGRQKRIANVRAAFTVAEPAKARGRKLLLVDDVLTTGSTASACARVLQRAGASLVEVLTLARAEF